MRIVEDVAGRSSVYLRHKRDLRRGALQVDGYELTDGVSWLDVIPSVPRGLAELGRERASGDEKFATLDFVLGERSPLHKAVPEPPLYRLDRHDHYAFYVRVPDLPAFLSHVAPVLERRRQPTLRETIEEVQEMKDEIERLLARRLRGYEVRSLRELGEGLDNAAFEVNGEMIVRTSKVPDAARRAESIRREADLLAAAARISTLPVPEPVFSDPDAGAIAYRKLPGVPLMDHPVAEPGRLAPALGRFLGRLHQAPLEEVEHLVERDAYPLAAWLRDAEKCYRGISGRLPDPARRQIEDFLASTPPAEGHAPTFCHNDLGSEHVLVDVRANAVTGIIDWTDAAITDPARDLALVYRDLGPEVCRLALAHYDSSFDGSDRERAVFYARCKLVEDLAYGFGNPGAERYAEAGLSHLDRTFA